MVLDVELPATDSSDAYVLLDQRDVVEVRAVGEDIVRHSFLYRVLSACTQSERIR